MFLKTLQGIVNLALFVALFFYMLPALFFTWYGPVIVSLLGGLYIWFVHYQRSINFQRQLQHVPTGEHKKKFEEIVRQCGVNPEDLELRYAYTGGQIALINGNVLVVDPLLCSLADGDSSSDTVKEIYRLHIEPTLTESIKQGFVKRAELLSSDIQEFILKHEVGHFVDNFSFKSLVGTFFVGFSVFYTGIMTAQLLYSYNQLMAIIAGILVATLVDIALQLFVTNYMLRYFAEKQADRFAVQHSSAQQSEQAADFFAKLQDITDAHNDFPPFLKLLPQEMLSGHPTGKKRAAYIRSLIKN